MPLKYALLSLLLSGCALNVTMMSRDSGTIHTGEMLSNGNGSGTMTVKIDGNTCTGPAVRVASGESFGLASTYGRTSSGQRVNAITTSVQSGDVAVKALMSCTDNTGLRCDLTGSGGAGGGICVDDKGRVFDILATRK